MFSKSAVHFITVHFCLNNMYVLHKGWVSSKRRKKNNSSRYEIYEENNRIHWDRLENTDIAK